MKFDEINEALKLMELDDYMEILWKTLSGILIIGEIRFREGTNGEAEVDNIDTANIGIN